jgi:hypothetical protein
LRAETPVVAYGGLKAMIPRQLAETLLAFLTIMLELVLGALIFML